MTHVTSVTNTFLNVHWDWEKPLLLGYSGGPDSKALLYALLECGAIVHLAHVDHGWRPESADEAEKLCKEAEQLGCPFHSIRLNGIEKTEEAARKARFAFFRSLSYETLLLAHQAEDLAETVLKRIFEGAHLPFLGGMEPVSHQHGMTLWRPFLSIRRSEILQFLEERSLKALSDSSNEDPTYLRSRLRLQLFPYLEQTFGKGIIDNLNILSERAFELRAYLDQKIASIPLQKGPWGVLADLNRLARSEQRYLIQKIGREEGLCLSRDVLETLLKWVEEGLKARHLVVKGKKILVDQGRIFFFL